MSDATDLFAQARDDRVAAGPTATGDSTLPPLAVRMRPRSLEEVRGQADVLRPGSPLRRLVEGSGGTAGPLSAIIWGPPGTGKTTLAHLVASARTGGSSSSPPSPPASRTSARSWTRPAATATCTTARRCSSSTRSTGSPRPSRTRCCPAWRTGSSSSSRPPPRTRRSASSPHCSPARSWSRSTRSNDDEIARASSTPRVADERGLAGGFTLDDDARAHLVRIAGGDARRALTALEAAAGVALDTEPLAADTDEPRQHRAHAYGTGRGAGRGPLRPGRRPALRRGQRPHQVDAGQRRRRGAALPRPDAGGRRGPPVHRPPHRHLGERGRRHGRPDRPADRRRGDARRRPDRDARGADHPGPGRRPQRDGAEVQRLLPRHRGGDRRRAGRQGRPGPAAPAGERLRRGRAPGPRRRVRLRPRRARRRRRAAVPPGRPGRRRRTTTGRPTGGSRSASAVRLAWLKERLANR